MPFVLTDIQQVELSIKPVDRRGNPAQLSGSPVWASTDESIVSVTAAPGDPMRCLAKAVGKLGTAQVNVRATNAHGKDIFAVLDVQVVADDAASFDVVTGTPTDETDTPLPTTPPPLSTTLPPPLTTTLPPLPTTVAPPLPTTVAPPLPTTVAPPLSTTLPPLPTTQPPPLSTTLPPPLSTTLPPQLSTTVAPLPTTVAPPLPTTLPPLPTTQPPPLTTPAPPPPTTPAPTVAGPVRPHHRRTRT